MRIKVKVKFKGEPYNTMFMTRKELVTNIKLIEENGIAIDWMQFDVCMTRWSWLRGKEWYSAPLYKYVPGQAMVPLTDDERFAKTKLSPKGFTQNGIMELPRS